MHKQLSLTESLDSSAVHSSLRSTLICFVLTHAATATHTFCSRYDFGPWPLLEGLSARDLPGDVFAAFRGTRAVMMNGFVFDELSAHLVRALASEARASGAAVFFDPGASSPGAAEGACAPGSMCSACKRILAL